ncbi:MAG: BlaI/MecI/CopY family transcriptional regulator [Negativicutes bacterium]|nr:BlaI/MecI/CopY family transcriptional regulator [Negativicutes bacterium]
MRKLSESELEIMLAIWSAPEAVKSSFVAERMKEKGWAKTTVLNFLARLVEKGFLACDCQGKSNLYTPLVKEEEYLKLENKRFLGMFYQNSVKNLVAGLYQNQEISSQDLEELKKFLAEKSKEV